MRNVLTSSTSDTEISNWFDSYIADVRIDQLLLQSGAMNEEKQEIYKAMINKDLDSMHNYARKSSSMFFLEKLISSYFIELFSVRKAQPTKLALQLFNSKILVWAEVMEDDEITENAFILSEAKINQEFAQYGFYISSTLVETTDGFKVPNQYQEVTINVA
jgi:hypothetical protein